MKLIMQTVKPEDRDICHREIMAVDSIVKVMIIIANHFGFNLVSNVVQARFTEFWRWSV